MQAINNDPDNIFIFEVFIAGEKRREILFDLLVIEF
jgi:hypothetical protein